MSYEFRGVRAPPPVRSLDRAHSRWAVLAAVVAASLVLGGLVWLAMDAAAILL
jgi:hypothetical protein